MSQGRRCVSRRPTDSLLKTPCHVVRPAACSLRAAAADVTPSMSGAKDSLAKYEVAGFVSLAPGRRIVVRDHETGELWCGSADMTFPELGFVWVFTDLGERKLLDMGVHSVWRPDTPGACTGADECRPEFVLGRHGSAPLGRLGL